MKKLFLALIALTFSTSAVLYSCGEDTTENPSTQLEQKQRSEKSAARQAGQDDFVTIKETTDLLSETIMNFGAKELIKNDNTYTFSTSKDLYLLGMRDNLKNYSFDYIDNTLSFTKDESYQIYSIDNTFYVETPYFKGLLEDVDQKNLNEDRKLNVLMIFLGEVTSDPVLNKTKFDDYSSRIAGGGCSFFNTVYNVGVGMNAAAAQANLLHNIIADVNDGDLKGCRSLGLSESTSLGVVHYATQAWCCP
ncbi:hypothetical protein [Chryseobacterium sediminis]|uniref:Uncharacterized protein n=1 Tax=Chryseobacterium sediminis TaxID=1679494 RepID=A0A5B2TSZ2_9FLAO|nr:hypothetical protein [Chryseobacterium sediminis]KAA2217666.1 hypothetical protein FW780_18700 [Chryseobacterium sediminis]